MPDDNPRPSTETYDLVLVGAGTASCLIASRLSQQLPAFQILVLEAGQHLREDPRVYTPGLSSSLQSDATYDWQYLTAPEPGLNNRRLKHPRGKLVGGTSAINSHSVVFPSHEWQDRIAEELLSDSNSAEWNAENMKECYSRWQTEDSGLKAPNDTKAWNRVQTSYPRSLDLLQLQWIKIFEEMGHTQKATGFTESSAGAFTAKNAIDSSKGERSHAGTALLEPALRRGNVTLKTGIKVDKIAFDEALTADRKLNAKGVQYTSQGKTHLVLAKDIILCAGVFESPAILERSGVGSKDVLAAARVSLRYELPGVGENLQDHLNCSLSHETKDHIPTHDESLRSSEKRDDALAEYFQGRTGRLSEGPAYSFAFTPLQMLETPSETHELTKLVKAKTELESSLGLRAQYSVIQKSVENPSEATATTFMLRSQRHRDAQSFPKDTPAVVDGNYVTVVAMLSYPFSRGSCHITPNGGDQLEVKFNYLSHPLDTEILARHILLIERLFQQPAFADVMKPNGKRLPRSFPYPISSLEDAKQILPINAATNYHPCSTCSMMREEFGGVVDEQLIVYGTKNVRICDASVLPIIPRGNIMTAVYAFAEKAAELICKEVNSSCVSE